MASRTAKLSSAAVLLFAQGTFAGEASAPPAKAPAAAPAAGQSLEKAVIDTSVKLLDRLKLDPAKVKLTSHYKKDLGADSLDRAEIMMALEDKFKVSIAEEAEQTVSTVQEMVDALKAALAKKKAPKESTK